jgi:hypothetical protein
MDRLKTLQERAKEKGKLLLIEGVSYLPKSDDVVIFDNTKLTEDAKGNKFEARGILKNVPVTRYTENANGRIYSKALWENVHKSGMFEGADCLANHAEDDGSVLNTVGVWHNFTVGESTSNADLYCIGEAGQLLLEKAKAGGKVGFSTVGFGELNESDGKSVIESTFEFENCDWVRKPSQNVFATVENLTESVKDKSKVLENKTTNILSENKIEVRNMDKMTEATFKNQIRSAIKEAIANENYVEAIKELKEVSKTIPSEMVEQVAQVESAIMQLQEKISTDKVNAEKELKESKETLESLTEKYDVACKTIEQLKENLEKASKIVEKSSDPAVIKSMKLMEADIEQFTEDRIKMEKDIEIFIEEIEKRDADLAIYEEDTEKRDADIERFIEERKEMKSKISNTSKQLKVAESHITKLEKILENEYGYEFEDDNLMVATEDYDEPMYDSYDDEVIGDNMVDDYLTDEFDLGYEAGYEAAIEDEFYESEDEDEEEELEEETEDEDKEDDDDKMAKVRDAKKESSKSKMKPEVISYYKAAVKETPALKDIKESILKSGSVFEAVKKVKIFEQKFGNDVHKLKENIAQDRSRKFKPYKLTLD